MTKFPVSEVFKSIQGEGVHMGMPAIFVRLAGCNLSCEFCDTDHRTLLGEISAYSIAERVIELCPPGRCNLIVITGGEPTLHPVEELAAVIRQMHKDELDSDCWIELETNGSVRNIKMHADIDFISISPKTKFYELKQGWCTSLKVLFPYLIDGTIEVIPTSWDLEKLKPRWKGLQPITTADGMVNIVAASAELEKLPGDWHLSVQLHKLINVM